MVCHPHQAACCAVTSSRLVWRPAACTTASGASCGPLPAVLQLANVSNSLTVDNNFQLANLSLPSLAYVGAKITLGSSLPAATACSQVGPGT